MKLVFGLIKILFLLMLPFAEASAHGYRQSATLSAEYVGGNALLVAKGQLISLEDFSRPGISDMLSMSVGIQSRETRPLYFGLCLLKSLVPDMSPHKSELLDYKSNYGYYKTSINLLGFHYGWSKDMLAVETKADPEMRYKGVPTYESLYPSSLRPYFYVGAVVEYFDFEREKARNQKWYISPTVSTGVAAFVHRYNAITMLRCGINHSSFISEIGIKTGLYSGSLFKIFYHCDYYYSLKSSRDNTFIQSAGIGYRFDL